MHGHKPTTLEEHQMTNYYKVELDGKTYTRSSKTKTYTHATVYPSVEYTNRWGQTGVAFGYVTWTSRLDLAGRLTKNHKSCTVLTAIEIDAKEFRQLNKKG